MMTKTNRVIRKGMSARSISGRLTRLLEHFFAKLTSKARWKRAQKAQNLLNLLDSLKGCDQEEVRKKAVTWRKKLLRGLTLLNCQAGLISPREAKQASRWLDKIHRELILVSWRQ